MSFTTATVDLRSVKSQSVLDYFEDVKSIRRSQQLIADSLEEIAKCLSENNSRL